ncbi:class I SAM-dependent methyltransferase [Alkalihalophilus pseudofirmus]|uniref:Class I SAM-dependent methyltransferase n=1 Tax=Alkalihalophilus pseudofirmus TaxID=79885 RepID=A0AAJ2KT59_ALKPS|nr:class I SAM-dependent methyltransferase [Alkalihalophilus pseudofirmus]MDV2884501.1 class I SAM-dependent methyltransferase [Alkalihalophilus pseudofirmus]WEG18744.1 class I SAM-dependent methyltransferase [Alkalihalophilus pseudofirmus]
MNHTWNKIIYKIWSPIYDSLFNSGLFLKARKQVFSDIPFKEGQKVLFAGVGTGADLELIDSTKLDITAIDFSPDMLKKAELKFAKSSIIFIEMNAQNMDFDENSFDIVVGSLILSVVPDAAACFSEMKRVLKSDGKIILFDKFAPETKKLSLPKKIIRPIVKLLGTDIGLKFEDIYKLHKEQLKILVDQPVMLNGMYRKIILKKCDN